MCTLIWHWLTINIMCFNRYRRYRELVIAPMLAATMAMHALVIIPTFLATSPADRYQHCTQSCIFSCVPKPASACDSTESLDGF